jgi:hypothetical protein
VILRHELKSRVVAKLTNARSELKDALNLSSPVARYDPVIIPELLRNRLAAIIDDIEGVLRKIEGSQ